MARVLQPVAGPSDDSDFAARGVLLHLWGVAVLLVFWSMVWHLIGSRLPLPEFVSPIAWAMGGILFIAMLLDVRRLRLLRQGERNERSSARAVMAELQQLDDRFVVFSEVQAGDLWLDQVVVGPTGLFAIRPCRGLRIDGKPPWSDVRQLLRQRSALRKLIRGLVAPRSAANVEPVLCVLDSELNHSIEKRSGVWVIGHRQLAAALLRYAGEAEPDAATTLEDSDNEALHSIWPAFRAVQQALADHWLSSAAD